MIWTIDLDDGTLTDALGSNVDREKDNILLDTPYCLPDFGSPWEKDEL